MRVIEEEPVEKADPAPVAAGNTEPDPGGLSSDAAQIQLRQVGPNSVADSKVRPLTRVFSKLWAPVPWMLEATIVLQLGLGDYTEALVIAALLAINVAIQYFQEGQANATLDALRSRLALNVVARRDGAWKTIPASGLVPGDVIQISIGKIVAADVKLRSGQVLADQSLLTGESLPVEVNPNDMAYAGALIRRGAAIAVVTATGSRTKFGKTAELVRDAHAVSSQQTAVLEVVRNLGIFSTVVIVAMSIDAFHIGLDFRTITPLILTAILAAIPVALPATFTLAAALAARRLAKIGILSTRLSAVNEAATMDVLCVDKTGTLTLNTLSVATVVAARGSNEAQVLVLACLASSVGGEDPLDTAILSAGKGKTVPDPPHLVQFTPFDPDRKIAEATIASTSGETSQVVKGAFLTVAALATCPAEMSQRANALEKEGSRVVAVSHGTKEGAMNIIGLIAISDTPRPDAAALIAELTANGIKTIMVTGDASTTAEKIANDVGMKISVCPTSPPKTVNADTYSIYAGVLPEDKYALVKALQAGGHKVGMCGDGANDAPALRQAQIGIAVSTATDVAKSAAGMVLTRPGLADIVAAVKEGRSSFQRILTYALNMILKKIVTVLLLAIGLLMTGHAILTPLLMVIIMLTGDLLAMSLTVDNVEASRVPNVWNIGNVTIAAIAIGSLLLLYYVGMLGFAQFELRLPTEGIRTMTFLLLVFGGQSTLYAVRQRHHLFKPFPNHWLIVSSVADLSIASFLAIFGIAMAPLPVGLVGATLAASVAFGLVINVLKIPLFARLAVA